MRKTRVIATARWRGAAARIETLDKEDVLRIHEHLVRDFAESNDPIAPSGVRSEALLESAIGRQHVALGDQMKYATIHENAATLLYGLCLDHPFHNGNKRTALVAMLVHLDRNKTSLFDVNQKELFNMMIGVASHSFEVRDTTKAKPRPSTRRKPDTEVAGIAGWILDRMDAIERGERQITFRELQRILPGFNYKLGNPKNNNIDILKIETKRRGVLFPKTVQEEKRINSIPYPGDNRIVPVFVMKQVRAICRLREEDGVDSVSFYDDAAIIDGFTNKYRTVLRRLAHR